MLETVGHSRLADMTINGLALAVALVVCSLGASRTGTIAQPIVGRRGATLYPGIGSPDR